MSEALEITGATEHDGSHWFTDDPLHIRVTVTDPDGGALASASVRVGLVDDTGQVEDSGDVTTDVDGKASLSLTATESTSYDVVAGAATSERSGYSKISTEYARRKPPFDLPTAGSQAGRLALDFSESDHSITTALI